MGAAHPTTMEGGENLDKGFVDRAIRSSVLIHVNGDERKGSGVVIPCSLIKHTDFSVKKYMVATNYHTFAKLEKNPEIHTSLPKTGRQKFKASLFAIFPTEDLALVSFEIKKEDRVDENSLPVPAIFPMEESIVKSPGEEVFAVGFHLGATLKVTKGIYSGWDVDKSRTDISPIHTVQRRGRMQITVHTSNGSSGGGLYSSSDGLLQGITDYVMLSYNRASTANFSIPISVLIDMIALVEQGEESGETIVVRTPLFGFCTRPMEEGMLRKLNTHIVFLNKGKRGSDGEKYFVRDGVVVTRVLVNGAAKNANIKEGDVITRVRVGDGSEYNLFMTGGRVHVDWALEPVSLFDLLMRSPMNKPVTFDGWKALDDGSGFVEFSSILNRDQRPYTAALKKIYTPYEKNDSIVDIGPLQVTELRMNHLQDFLLERIEQDITLPTKTSFYSMAAIRSHVQDRMHESHIIIVDVEPGVGHITKIMAYGYCLLLKINGETVSLIEQVNGIYSKLRESGDTHFKVTFWDISGVHDALCRIDGKL
jgi:S1-C subfamily serine protease